MSLLVEALGIERRGRRLLDGVSLDLQQGELLAIVGPNGAGKTTLLSAMAGDLAPDAGSVKLDGRMLAQWTPLALARRRAVMPQASRLGFSLAVRAVVTLGRAPYRDRADAAADAHAVDRALKAADILHLAQRAYDTLSGGEQQRVQLARVIAQLDLDTDGAAPILLLDEPTASLDLAHAYGVLQLAHRMSRHGVAIAAVLHDLSLAYRYSDRVLVLKDGRTEALGDPRSVLNVDLVRRVFSVESQVVDDCLMIRGPALPAVA
ncbi:heme ABC transporter ATP-binding protein [Ferrovibrio terrae]|uniref:Heme ABC transporter ATP-binding protein n=1 Tax=Ferrovibrio terrae TaxID=2594003 RepID=A0A516H623_9PROT|nr:heme ABC transporter ATP-binding protein [Ferrovibrio terrae]QDO99216.1 heme ABC transporter ATP-binding protein [Ferrovibrio terrae]